MILYQRFVGKREQYTLFREESYKIPKKSEKTENGNLTFFTIMFGLDLKILRTRASVHKWRVLCSCPTPRALIYAFGTEEKFVLEK
jgi:hypothetical protein